MQNKNEIIDDRLLKYLFLVYLSPLLIITGLSGLLRGKAILRYITIEGPIGIMIDYVYIVTSLYFLFMFTYTVAKVIKRTVTKHNLKIILFALLNIMFYILAIVYVLDEYYVFVIIKDWLSSLIGFIILIIANYIYLTLVIYYVFRLLTIIE